MVKKNTSTSEPQPKYSKDEKLKICGKGAKLLDKHTMCRNRVKLRDLGIHKWQRRCDSGHAQSLLRRVVWTESFTKRRYK